MAAPGSSADSSDDLDYNPFYRLLRSKYREQLENAQNKCLTVCIPRSDSIRLVQITQEFLESHILKPSPYFQGHYDSTDSEGKRTVEIDGAYIHTKNGFDQDEVFRILSEELAYNKEFKPYKILIIDRPFINSKVYEKEVSQLHSHLILYRTSFEQNKQFLFSVKEFVETLRKLITELKIFNNNYMVLVNYLDEAACRLRCIADRTTKMLYSACPEAATDRRVRESIERAVDSYSLGETHKRVFVVVCKQMRSEDEELYGKLKELDGVSAEQFGLELSLTCPLPAAVVELARLDSLRTPLEKLLCFKTTLDQISDGVHSHMASLKHDSAAISNKNAPEQEPLCLTSDDLLLLLIPVIVQCKLKHLISNIYYIDHFHRMSSTKDDLGYSLVTFKAAIEIIKSTNAEKLKPAALMHKKEVSFEELLAATERVKLAEGSGSSSMTDRKLERIGRMIEQSSQEMRTSNYLYAGVPDVVPLSDHQNHQQQQASGGGGGSGTGSSKPLGEFLSSLQGNVLGRSYGRQT